MITFPTGFIATGYSGYFYHPASKQLYSIKVSGELKPLKQGKCWNPRSMYSSSVKHGEPGFTISQKGHRRFVPLKKLEALIETEYEIPVK